MGIADSRLRDRVIFVEGSPRSGTRWLVTLLGLHPDIAGLANESHLFDVGADRLFQNLEFSDRRFLRAYLDRPDLVGLVRDLCDGVLLRMKEGTKREASYVVEKTPVSAHEGAAAAIARKAECYPDAWYVHIVRDGHDVARSLMRMPWMKGMSEQECYEDWRECVESIRHALSSSHRYRELAYADLKADPRGSIAGVLDWIGLDRDPVYLDEVEAASRVPHDGWPNQRTSPTTTTTTTTATTTTTTTATAARPVAIRKLVARALPGPVRKRLVRLARGERGPDRAVMRSFIDALRAPTDAGLQAVTTADVTVRVTEAGAGTSSHRSATGDDGRRLLAEAGTRTFSPRLASEGWSIATGAWAPDGSPAVNALVSGTRGDGTRVDAAFALGVSDGRVASATIFITHGRAFG